MNLILLGLGILLLAGCPSSYVYIVPPSGTGSIDVRVIQYREGVGSFLGLDGVQANLPLYGSTVSDPKNTPKINKVK